MPPQTRTPPSIIGIDVSSHQPPARVPWEALRDAGKASFAFMRTGYGIGPDETFTAHVKRARAAGVELIGGYHAARPTRPIMDQVDILSRQADAVGGEIVPVLDLETMDDRTPRQVADFALEFVVHVEERFRRPCVFYTYPWYASMLPLARELADRPLWIAHYLVMAPNVPKPWKQWTIHQYDGDGAERAPSLNGPGMDLDFNRFRGTVQALRNALRGPVRPVPDPLPPAVHDADQGVCLPPPLICEEP